MFSFWVGVLTGAAYWWLGMTVFFLLVTIDMFLIKVDFQTCRCWEIELVLLALLTHAGSWDEAFDGRKIACHAVLIAGGSQKRG